VGQKSRTIKFVISVYLGKTLIKIRQILYSVRCNISQYFMLKITQISGLRGWFVPTDVTQWRMQSPVSLHRHVVNGQESSRHHPAKACRGIARIIVLEYVFYDFFKIQKKRDFLRFFEVSCQKNVKKRRKPYPSFMYTNQITGIRRLQNWVLSEM